MELQFILCQVDSSQFSGIACQHALSLADHYKAKLVALRVVEFRKYPFADYVG